MAALELKVPPVALVLIFGAAMWLISCSTPALHLRLPFQRAAAVTFALAGVATSTLGFHAFRRAKTTVNPMKPASSSSLVVCGIYRHTRNPMYLGFLLVLCGWSFWLGHLAAFALLPAFIAYMDFFQIGPEERALTSLFGEHFRAYCARVRRWI